LGFGDVLEDYNILNEFRETRLIGSKVTEVGDWGSHSTVMPTAGFFSDKQLK
jgi:hypothetical protein